MKEYIESEMPKIKSNLKKNFSKLQDKVVKIKLTEAINSMDKLCGIGKENQVVKDASVVQTIRYMELSKELNKIGRKTKKSN